MFGDLEDDKTLLGADDVGNVARLHGERLVLKFLGQRGALEVAEIAALGGGGSVGILFGDVVEGSSLANLGQQVVRLGLRRREFLLLHRLEALCPSFP